MSLSRGLSNGRLIYIHTHTHTEYMCVYIRIDRVSFAGTVKWTAHASATRVTGWRTVAVSARGDMIISVTNGVTVTNDVSVNVAWASAAKTAPWTVPVYRYRYRYIRAKRLASDLSFL